MRERPAVKKSFGACTFAKASPSLTTISPATKILNLAVSFEEALKLNIAIHECVRTLNSYNRAKKAGKRSALLVAVHMQSRRITVHEGRV